MKGVINWLRVVSCRRIAAGEDRETLEKKKKEKKLLLCTSEPKNDARRFICSEFWFMFIEAENEKRRREMETCIR